MKISNEQLSKLYEEENGKLLLGLSNTRFNQYVEIINNTKAYIEIIKSIPQNLSNLEKAYYIYNKLGILLYENESLVYNHIENIGMYYSTIRDNGIGNCRQMCELYVTMLTMTNTIERFYLTRKPVGVEKVDLRHIDAIIQIDGKLYMTDIIRDTVNMRAGIKNMKFGYIDTEKKRIDEIISFINENSIIGIEQRNTLIEYIKQKQFEKFLIDMSELQKKYDTDLGIEFLKRKIPKIEYALLIKEQIGELTEIPRKAQGDKLSIEYLDRKTNMMRSYKDIGFPFYLKLKKYHYLEEIIDKEFIPQMFDNDSSIRKRYSYANNILPSNMLEENIELDIEIILNFFFKIEPEIDLELCFKYLKYVLERIYETRSYNGKTIDRGWINKNIRFYKMINECDIENNSSLFHLMTLIAVRIEKKGQKYDFFELGGEKKYKRVPYREMIAKLKIEKPKICFKFSDKRKDTLGELEI